MLLWSILIIGGAAYVLLVGAMIPPRYSVLGFVLGWALFPKGAETLPGLGGLGVPGLPISVVVETVVAIGIVVAILNWRSHVEPSPEMVRLQRLLIVFLAVALLAETIAGLMSSSGFYPDPFQNPFAMSADVLRVRKLSIVVNLVSAMIWAWGASLFLNRLQDIELLFACLLLIGAELLFEVTAIFYGGLFPQLQYLIVREASGDRFWSLTMLDYLMAATFSGLAFIVLLYFGMTRRSLAVLAVAPVMLLPLFLSYQRSILTGLVVGATFFAWHSVTPRLKPAIAFSAAAVLIMVVVPGNLVGDLAGDLLGRTVRPDYFSTLGLEARLANWVRAAELIVTMPLGVGIGAAENFMATPLPEYLLIPRIEGTQASYYSMAWLGRPRGAHNVYLQVTAELGLLGLSLVALFCYVLVSNYRKFRSGIGLFHEVARRGDVEDLHRPARRLYFAQVFLYSCAIFLGAHYVFNHGPYVPIVWSMLLFLSFRLQEFQNRLASELR